MKQIKILSSSMFIFFMLCFSVYAASNVYQEDWTIQQDYTVLGYGYSSSCANIPTQPVTSRFNNFAYGLNGSYSCGDSIMVARSALSSSISSGALTIYFDFYVNSSDTFQYVGFSLYNRTSLTGGGYKIIEMDINNNSYSLSSDYTGFSSAACDNTIQGNYNYLNNRVIIDYDSKTYDIYLNDTRVCNETLTTSNTQVISARRIDFLSLYKNGQTIYSNFDNIDVTSSASNLSTVPFGYPCNIDSDCVTDRCVGGYCAKKIGGAECTTSSECISGSCINGECLRPSTWQTIEHEKQLQMGDDDDTNNMLSMIFMVIAMVGSIIIGLKAGGGFGAVILGFLAYYVAFAFFAVIGWLSFFMIFIHVLILILVIIAIIFLKSQTN